MAAIFSNNHPQSHTEDYEANTPEINKVRATIFLGINGKTIAPIWRLGRAGVYFIRWSTRQD
jgi:hypothetical protein